MSLISDLQMTSSWPFRRSASLPRRTGLRKNHNLESSFSGSFLPGETLTPSIRSHTLSTRGGVSPRPSAVDPELRNAQKLGNRYHITMNLNALLDLQPKVNMALLKEGAFNETATDYNTFRSLSSFAPRRSSHLRSIPASGSSAGGRKSVIKITREDLPLTNQLEIKGRQMELRTEKGSTAQEDGYVIRSVLASSLDRPRTATANATLEDGFIIRSVTPSHSTSRRVLEEKQKDDETVSFDLQLIGGTDVRTTSQQTSFINNVTSSDVNRQLTKTSKQQTTTTAFGRGGETTGEPNYTMTIDETMTMDYQPEESRPVVDTSSIAKQVKRNRSPRSRTGKGSSQDDQKMRFIAHQYRNTLPAAPKAAPRNSQRKRSKPVKREPEETREKHSPAARGKIKIDEQKRVRNLKGEDKSDEAFVVFERVVPINRNAVGQRLSKEAFDELDFGKMLKADDANLPQRPSALTNRTLFQRDERIFSEERGRKEPNSDDEFHTEIEITRGLSEKPRSMPAPSFRPSPSTIMPTKTTTSAYVDRLMKDAPMNSVRQRMDVHREEEEIAGPLPERSASGQSSAAGLLNVDMVSEKVEMKMADGVAQMVVKVRCERLVPIQGSADLYKKTSIIVSRYIDVDLTVTEERRRIYDQVMMNRLPSGKLSNKDTFELYQAFMELAELHPSAEWDQEQLWIDKKVDEERVAKYGSLENHLGGDDAFDKRDRLRLASHEGRTSREARRGQSSGMTQYSSFGSASAGSKSPLVGLERGASKQQIYTEKTFDERPVNGEKSMRPFESNYNLSSVYHEGGDWPESTYRMDYHNGEPLNGRHMQDARSTATLHSGGAYNSRTASSGDRLGVEMKQWQEEGPSREESGRWREEGQVMIGRMDAQGFTEVDGIGGQTKGWIDGEELWGRELGGGGGGGSQQRWMEGGQRKTETSAEAERRGGLEGTAETGTEWKGDNDHGGRSRTYRSTHSDKTRIVC